MTERSAPLTELNDQHLTERWHAISFSIPGTQQLRNGQGYSQEGFAATCGLDRTYIGGIERGERNLALRNIEVIAQTLRITLAELMKGL